MIKKRVYQRKSALQQCNKKKTLHFHFRSQLISCNWKSPPCCCRVLHFSYPNSCPFLQALRAAHLPLSLFWYKPPSATNDPVGTTSSSSAVWQRRQKSSCPPQTLTPHTSTSSKEVLKHKIFKLTHYRRQKENTLRLVLRCRTNSTCSALATPTLLASVPRKTLHMHTVETTK